MNTSNKKETSWKQRILHELVEYWLTVLFMTIVFGVFFTYRRLILAHYEVSYASYGITVIKALVLAKVVLVAETLRVHRRLEDKPLIIPTFLNSLIFTGCVALFSIVESMIRSFIHGAPATEAFGELMSEFNYEWLAGAFAVFFAFIPFFALRGLRQVLGEETMRKLFFQGRFAVKPALAEQGTLSVKE